MCGIFLCVSAKAAEQKNCQEVVETALKRRGPDSSHKLKTCISDDLEAMFLGYTLWLQGSAPTQQPVVDKSGNILLWNGDVFYNQIAGENIKCGYSDTKCLMEILEKVETVNEICGILESIKGPWSLIYYRKKMNLIITGRDRFGRHSLLWNHVNNSDISIPLVISSSSQIGDFTEIPASHLYQINLENSPSVEKICPRKPYVINKSLTYQPQSNDWDTNSLAKESSDYILNRYKSIWQKEIEELETTLLKSIKSRIFCQPMLCKACVQIQNNGVQDQTCTHSKIAILFSGGLDSSVLAALTDRVWPSSECIDLLNVAFPSRTKTCSEEKFGVPDRLTGLQALEELKKISPTRKWNFVEINVELEELMEVRKSRIASLIYPASTVLDDSIGCAQWFAARGEGRLLGCTNGKTYVSPARVILMGAGADEQMAGYARHRKRFSDGGWSALITEMEMEMNRISERNLGRDNRIIADHGRAPRLPYLDENVVDYLAQLPVLAKVDLRLPSGIGDKIILRSLAYHLGLKKTATEPKRAIQFGSRIAKTEARKEKGSHICDRLVRTHVSED